MLKKMYVTGINSEKDAVRQTRLNGLATALEFAASLNSSSPPFQLNLDQGTSYDQHFFN